MGGDFNEKISRHRERMRQTTNRRMTSLFQWRYDDHLTQIVIWSFEIAEEFLNFRVRSCLFASSTPTTPFALWPIFTAVSPVVYIKVRTKQNFLLFMSSSASGFRFVRRTPLSVIREDFSCSQPNQMIPCISTIDQ